MLTRKTLSLADAKQIAAAASAKAVAEGWNVVIAIHDNGGNLVYLERADGTQLGSIVVAQEKSRTALRFKRPTKALEDIILAGRVHMMSLPGITSVEGGSAHHRRWRDRRQHRRLRRAVAARMDRSPLQAPRYCATP